MSKVFLAVPQYDGRGYFYSTRAALEAATCHHEVRVYPFQSSLLPHNCTAQWAHALNLHDNDPALKWFAMLHDDIRPEDGWIDRLIEAAENYGADFVSAVSPLKNRTGCTSTALLASNRPGGVVRLTLAQVNHPLFPVTFDVKMAADALGQLPDELRISGVPHEGLLANTGCMVCRLDRPWCNEVWFQIQTSMMTFDGKRESVTFPEDWYFTQGITRLGGRVFCTKHVRLTHYGIMEYNSADVWGLAREEFAPELRGPSMG